MRPPKDDVKNFLSRISPFIEKDGGRNLNSVSRELSLPYQTLRERILRLPIAGISVLPKLNPGRIGLQRFRVQVRLSPSFSSSSRSFFGGLHQKSGLIYYARSLLSSDIDSEFVIPTGSGQELSKLLRALREMNIISDFTVRELAWKEILSMQTHYYDYENNSWDVDYTGLRSDPSINVPRIEEPGRYDHTDLLIIKSLQINTFFKSVELAKEIGVTAEDVAYHLKRHVFGQKLILGFAMKWAGPKEAWFKHSILGITLAFENLPEEAAAKAMSVMTSVPFIWNHMRAIDGTYMTELLVPASHFSEAIRYISDNLRSINLKPRVEHVDWSYTRDYTIPYMMHDSARGWEFKAEESLAYLIEMIRVYK